MPPPKLAQKGAGPAKSNRSGFVRGLAEKLREIEARLDHGLSSRWLRDLAAADDLAAVALLLTPLQAAAALSVEDFSQLSDRSLAEEVQADLCRRFQQRVEELDRSVPPARNPASMLGEVVLKHFDGHGTYMGTIVEFDVETETPYPRARGVARGPGTWARARRDTRRRSVHVVGAWLRNS